MGHRVINGTFIITEKGSLTLKHHSEALILMNVSNCNQGATSNYALIMVCNAKLISDTVR